MLTVDICDSYRNINYFLKQWPKKRSVLEISKRYSPHRGSVPAARNNIYRIESPDLRALLDSEQVLTKLSSMDTRLSNLENKSATSEVLSSDGSPVLAVAQIWRGVLRPRYPIRPVVVTVCSIGSWIHHRNNVQCLR